MKNEIEIDVELHELPLCEQKSILEMLVDEEETVKNSEQALKSLHDSGSKGFTTCNSGPEEYSVTTKFKSLAEAHAFHLALIRCWVLVRDSHIPSVSDDSLVVMPARLTAENGAKALLCGEFTVNTLVPNPDYCGCGNCDSCENSEEPETLVREVQIPWTTIKKIYEKAVGALGRKVKR